MMVVVSMVLLVALLPVMAVPSVVLAVQKVCGWKPAEERTLHRQ